MEKTLTAYLKEKQPDSTGARLDITYRASSGRHIVVEMKKPTKTSLNYFELYEQVTKYKDAVEAYYNKRFFIKCTVKFLVMSENSVFQTHRCHHERHRPLRTPSWAENAVVGEVC